MTTRQPETNLDVRLLVHTHWDREWYRPFPRFRSRLVSLIDEVLDGTAGSPFLLDGQAVVLEDYLEVRPERSADVSTALRQGALEEPRLEAGPWYVLADALIPSGEGLVRNLLAGRRVLRSLRAVAPDVLYCPDSFGHPAALPAIAAGFGCPVVVLWRGYGGASHPSGDTARWKAPDESEVILYHLPPDGYEYGSHLPAEPEAARERWNAMREVLHPRATTGLALVTVGADHHAPPVNLGESIDALRRAASPATVKRVSLGNFGRELRERAMQRVLPVVSGELRDSYGYTWTLQGTLGARAGLKRRYALVESLLVRDVEPWAALARLYGDRVDRRAVLRAAWRPVLLCQPHDTLCGCSVDEVATAMSSRLADAESAATEIREASIGALVGHDGNTARRTPGAWSPVVVVRNAAPRWRSGVAEIGVDLVLDDAPVGPASAGIEPRARPTSALSLGSPALPVQEVSRARTFVREEASQHYPWNRLVERRRVLAWVPDVPAYGIVTLPIHEKRRRAAKPPFPVSGRGRVIEGNGLRIEAHASHLSLTSADGVHIADWIAVEGEGERGDLYTRSAIHGTHARAALLRSRLTAGGPLRAELTCDWRLAVPERRLTSASGEPRRAPAARLDLQTIIQLDAGAPFARITVRGNNSATDIRLRLGIHTGLESTRVVADAAFGPVVREPITGPEGAESVPPTAPLHRYVSTFTEDSGATLVSDGLAEYEVSDGIVWVTLLRAVGELSRHNLPERPGHAGYPVPTPDAQSIGPFEASLGFFPHGPHAEDVASRIDQVAEDALRPLRGDTWRTAVNPPLVVTGPELSGNGLVQSAIKESEDGEWIVLRCTNLLDRPVSGSWHLPSLREAMLARLDETPLEGLPVVNGRVEFVAPRRAAITILVR
jgi:alpha-mannosidase